MVQRRKVLFLQKASKARIEECYYFFKFRGDRRSPLIYSCKISRFFNNLRSAIVLNRLTDESVFAIIIKSKNVDKKDGIFME